MKTEMAKIGVDDTPANREMIEKHLNKVLNDPNSIVKTGTKTYIAKELPGKPEMSYLSTTRESFLMGPLKGVVIESVWNGDQLVTIIIKGGK